jgi:hypothetical protein
VIEQTNAGEYAMAVVAHFGTFDVDNSKGGFFQVCLQSRLGLLGHRPMPGSMR